MDIIGMERQRVRVIWLRDESDRSLDLPDDVGLMDVFVEKTFTPRWAKTRYSPFALWRFTDRHGNDHEVPASDDERDRDIVLEATSWRLGQAANNRYEDARNRNIVECRLRRQLKRKGYALRKSRIRNECRKDYGTYMVIDLTDNTIAAGGHWGLDLAQVAHAAAEPCSICDARQEGQLS